MDEEQDEDDEEQRIEKRDRRFNIEMVVLFVIFLALSFLPGPNNQYTHHVYTPEERKNMTLALAFVGVALLYMGLFTPRGYIERLNERTSRSPLPEWGWFGRIVVTAVGAWLTWWQGGELLTYMGF